MTGAGVHVWSAFGAAGPPAESEASPLIYPFYDIFTTIGATTARRCAGEMAGIPATVVAEERRCISGNRNPPTGIP